MNGHMHAHGMHRQQLMVKRSFAACASCRAPVAVAPERLEFRSPHRISVALSRWPEVRPRWRPMGARPSRPDGTVRSLGFCALASSPEVWGDARGTAAGSCYVEAYGRSWPAQGGRQVCLVVRERACYMHNRGSRSQRMPGEARLAPSLYGTLPQVCDESELRPVRTRRQTWLKLPSCGPKGLS